MTLQEYIKQEGRGSISALAIKCGAAQPTITCLLSGRRNASPSLALRIEKATDGAVTAPELLAHVVPQGYELRKVQDTCADCSLVQC